jgi:TetR/AcrR family transcriptional regulator, regulator of cefoperazone and chloramphenicol sensitivity
VGEARSSSRPAARLLEAAIQGFGEHGLDGASTRAIAGAASTPMSQITYHFGGKEGLYLAAARHIAEEFGRRIGSVMPSWDQHNGSPTDPTAEILALLDRYTQVLLSPASAGWAPFIIREQLNPTRAFDVLYSSAIGKAVDRAAALVAAASQGRCDRLEARIRIIAIIGQALVFRLARATVLRATGWSEVGPSETAAVRRIVRSHTTAILTDISEPDA